MALRIYNLDPVTITSGGTAEPIYSGSGNIYVDSITIQADYANVGKIAIGGPGVTPTNGILIAPGESAVIEYPQHGRFADEFLLNNVYVNSSSSGDSARIAYIKRE